MLARPPSCLGQATVEKGGIQFGALLYLIKRLHKSLSTLAGHLFQWNLSSVKDKLFSFQNTSHFFSVILNGYLVGIRKTIFLGQSTTSSNTLGARCSQFKRSLGSPSSRHLFWEHPSPWVAPTHLSQT